MARLRDNFGSDDELPPLSEILARSQGGVEGSTRTERGPQQRLRKEHGSRKTFENDKGNHAQDLKLTETTTSKPQLWFKQITSGGTPNRKQRPLQKTTVNSLLLPISCRPSRLETPEGAARKSRGEQSVKLSLRKTTKAVDYKGFIADLENALGSEDEDPIRSPTRSVSKGGNSTSRDLAPSTPKRAVETLDYKKFVSDLGDALESDGDPSFDDLSDFIVNDSASEAEVVFLRSPRKGLRSPLKASTSSVGEPRSSNNDLTCLKEVFQPEVIDLISPIKDITIPNNRPKKETTAGTHDDDPFSIVKFSPPGNRYPYRSFDKVRFTTPPSSPSKIRLQSPSKQPRIPPSPHRPSIDAFWSQDVINDWNDQYSPKKTEKHTPGTRLFPIIDDEDDSPSTSPKKSPSKTSPRKDKATIARRKAFNERKYSLATSFLQELDLKVTSGQVASLAAATGGINIIWSKKLNSTAGRANWKRDALKTKDTDGNVTTTYRHHASIELAEKVIDDEDRLYNVLAHEYCHLTNFMISNIKTAPHGPSFKLWAAKVTTLFRHKNIEVTTKHSYKIDYKYAWVCEGCGVGYERHSRSIDTKRVRCGACKGCLVQVRPAPRGGGGLSGKGGVGGEEWREYVRREFGRVKSENEGMGQGEIMAILGRGFREGKKRERENRGVSVEDLEIKREGEGEGEGEREGDGLVERLGGLTVQE